MKIGCVSVFASMGPAAAITLVTAVTVSYCADVPWRGAMKSEG